MSHFGKFPFAECSTGRCCISVGNCYFREFRMKLTKFANQGWVVTTGRSIISVTSLIHRWIKIQKNLTQLIYSDRPSIYFVCFLSLPTVWTMTNDNCVAYTCAYTSHMCSRACLGLGLGFCVLCRSCFVTTGFVIVFFVYFLLAVGWPSDDTCIKPLTGQLSFSDPPGSS